MAALTDAKRCTEKFKEIESMNKGRNFTKPLCLLCDKCTGLTEKEEKFHCMQYGELYFLGEGWQAIMCRHFKERVD